MIRSIKTKNIRDRDVNFVKEIGWDDRFHLGKLTNYDLYKDVNCNFYIKLFP